MLVNTKHPFYTDKKKQKTKTHGTLKNREAFKDTLKQWGLIRQAMLRGTDCFLLLAAFVIIH